MKKYFLVLNFALAIIGCQNRATPYLTGTPADRESLKRTTPAIRDVPKNGGPASIGRDRSMVVYIKYPKSPTGWVSLREMAQEAPAK